MGCQFAWMCLQGSKHKDFTIVESHLSQSARKLGYSSSFIAPAQPSLERKQDPFNGDECDGTLQTVLPEIPEAPLIR
jgi:hypothetical protein